MKWIAVFLPSIITITIRYKRSNGDRWKILRYISEYFIAVICNVVITQSTVQYFLSDGVIDTKAFERFTFFTKYMIIACVLAFIIPYIYEIISKYIHVSIKVKERVNEEK